MKRCNRCGITKPGSEFHFLNKDRGWLASACKPCEKARKAESWAAKRAADPVGLSASQRANMLMKNYGITVEQYDEMLAEQSGVCAVCGMPETAKAQRGRAAPSLAVDHDHKTGKVRGLLCRRCNSAEGLLDSDSNRALALAAYIIQHEEIPCLIST